MTSLDASDLDTYDQQLMTAVVQRAERAGKEVKPLIIPTNNPLYAIIRTAKDLGVQELVMGAYEHAVDVGYRFYSYGDCMLVL